MTHAEVRELLALGAAGLLDAATERGVQDHLRECPECAAEFEGLAALAQDLRGLPVPHAPAGLVLRTVELVAAERRHNHIAVAMAVVFAWVVWLAAWGVFQVLTEGIVAPFHASLTGLLTWMAISTAFSWATAGVAVALLGRRRMERSLV
jgi:predicted anti-sigma-YlaC factor YlaD